MIEKTQDRFIVTTDNYSRYIAKLGSVTDEKGKTIPVALTDNNLDAISFCSQEEAKEFIYRAAKKLGRPESDFTISRVEMVIDDKGNITWG